jgi:hypothetical protein
MQAAATEFTRLSVIGLNDVGRVKKFDGVKEHQRA